MFAFEENISFNWIAVIIFAVLGGCCSLLSEAVLVLYRKTLISIQTGMLKRGGSYTSFLWCSFVKKLKRIWKKCIIRKDVEIEVKRMSRGLVGVIAVDINSVSNTKIDENNTGFNEIYFADQDGDYYNRNTSLSEEVIENQCKIIEDHYKSIQEEINRNLRVVYPQL